VKIVDLEASTRADEQMKTWRASEDEGSKDRRI